MTLEQKAQQLERAKQLGLNYEQGGGMDYVEGIGGARYEAATKKILQRSMTAGADFIENGRPVSLKGLLGVDKVTGGAKVVTENMVEGLINAAVHDVKYNSYTKKLVVDLFNLTDEQQIKVMEKIYNQVPNSSKDIFFVR